MRRNEEEQSAKLIRYVLGVLLGGAVALLACFLFLLMASIGISRGWISQDLMYQVTVVGCVLGGFIGGVTAVQRCGSRALVVGLLTGAVFFLLLLTVEIVFYKSAAPQEGGIGLLCGALCGGAAAGLLSRGGSRRAKKHRSKR